MDFSYEIRKRSGEKSISHGKPYKMYFNAYLTLQGTLLMLNTLHKVEDHENHARWIYLTTILHKEESQKYVRKYIFIINIESADRSQRASFSTHAVS